MIEYISIIHHPTKVMIYMIEELKKSLLDAKKKILVFMEILVVKSYENNEKYR